MQGFSQRRISRRNILKLGAAGLAATAAGGVEMLAWTPVRQAHAAPARLPNIQFDIGAFVPPAETLDGVPFRFGPVFTRFVTLALTRTPSLREQRRLAGALETLEDVYPFSPGGVFTILAYGIPYFARLPGGMERASELIPRLRADEGRLALEEAVPSPTDVCPTNPGISKKTFNLAVLIERNDLLVSIRSDSAARTQDAASWLFGGSDRLRGRALRSPRWSGLFLETSNRLMFVQPGLPRKVADSNHLPFAAEVHPRSPMWMGFADQQTSGAGPAEIVTFQGNGSARLTDAESEDYFADGSIQHLSHNIQDLTQWYEKPAEPFTERVQYMFRSNPIPAAGNVDQFSDGGGPAFLPNLFQGADDADKNAAAKDTFNGEHRMGHLTALQRSSRAADGTPIHIRMDGPGFDSLDVPGGTPQPKLQFSIFVPSADFFQRMRRNQASLDLVAKSGVQVEDNGVERFITSTRRQNFLVPPRKHRAFPLVEILED